MFICYKQSPDIAHSDAFSQRSSNPRLIEDETFNDSDITNNLMDYEEPDSLRMDKNIQACPETVSQNCCHTYTMIPVSRSCLGDKY
ncbi:hypothetical protein TNCV_1499931 [Trichonephila clavipes]|nr:hypothetical protein TNCV_1499931 [Trichonephila clavipes]